jgi:hypothetical protein
MHLQLYGDIAPPIHHESAAQSVTTFLWEMTPPTVTLVYYAGTTVSVVICKHGDIISFAVLIAVYLFIYLFICMFVNRITQKVFNRIA